MFNPQKYRWLRAALAAGLVPTLLIYTNYEAGNALREIHVFFWTIFTSAFAWQEKPVRHQIIGTFLKIAFFPITIMISSSSYFDEKPKRSAYEERKERDRNWDDIHQKQWWEE
jgi:hypothetical protein